MNETPDVYGELKIRHTEEYIPITYIFDEKSKEYRKLSKDEMMVELL